MSSSYNGAVGENKETMIMMSLQSLIFLVVGLDGMNVRVDE